MAAADAVVDPITFDNVPPADQVAVLYSKTVSRTYSYKTLFSILNTNGRDPFTRTQISSPVRRAVLKLEFPFASERVIQWLIAASFDLDCAKRYVHRVQRLRASDAIATQAALMTCPGDNPKDRRARHAQLVKAASQAQEAWRVIQLADTEPLRAVYLSGLPLG